MITKNTREAEWYNLVNRLELLHSALIVKLLTHFGPNCCKTYCVVTHDDLITHNDEVWKGDNEN